MEIVTMRSPSGEERDVPATSEDLSPLMAAGWRQAPPAAAPEPEQPAKSKKTPKGKE